MADPLRLDALTRTTVRAATEAYQHGGSLDDWERAMRAALARGHTAAYLTGLGERSFGGRVREFLGRLVGERALSGQDRGRLRDYLKRQLQFLDKFVSDIRSGRLSDAQIAARAEMYAGATRGTYYGARWGDWDIPEELMPGNQQCKANCRCSISVRDNEDGTGVLTRTLGGERHCTACPSLAGDHPIRRRSG